MCVCVYVCVWCQDAESQHRADADQLKGAIDVLQKQLAVCMPTINDTR